MFNNSALKIAPAGLICGALLAGCGTVIETPQQGIVVSKESTTEDLYHNVYRCLPSVDAKGNATVRCGIVYEYDRTIPTVTIAIKSCMPSGQGTQIITKEYAQKHLTYPSDYPLSSDEVVELPNGDEKRKVSCGASFELTQDYGQTLKIGQFVTKQDLEPNFV